MIDPETLRIWAEWSKRDDACNLFIPSDIRLMLGDIDRLKAEVELWKDRYESERRNHESTMEQADAERY